MMALILLTGDAEKTVVRIDRAITSICMNETGFNDILLKMIDLPRSLDRLKRTIEQIETGYIS